VTWCVLARRQTLVKHSDPNQPRNWILGSRKSERFRGPQLPKQGDTQMPYCSNLVVNQFTIHGG